MSIFFYKSGQLTPLGKMQVFLQIPCCLSPSLVPFGCSKWGVIMDLVPKLCWMLVEFVKEIIQRASSLKANT